MTNYVSSPLGYATILSILGHGSVGSTREEIFRVLELPENLQDGKKNYFKNYLIDTNLINLILQFAIHSVPCSMIMLAMIR